MFLGHFILKLRSQMEVTYGLESSHTPKTTAWILNKQQRAHTAPSFCRRTFSKNQVMARLNALDSATFLKPEMLLTCVSVSSGQLALKGIPGCFLSQRKESKWKQHCCSLLAQQRLNACLFTTSFIRCNMSAFVEHIPKQMMHCSMLTVQMSCINL